MVGGCLIGWGSGLQSDLSSIGDLFHLAQGAEFVDFVMHFNRLAL